jgi:hypothetical protein
MQRIPLYRRALRQPIAYTYALSIMVMLLLSGCGLPGSSTDTAHAPTATPNQPAQSAAAQASPSGAPAALPGANWVRHSYGTAWNIEHPADWKLNLAGQAEGFLGMQGSYDGHPYEVSFSYPMIDPAVPSVDVWVQQELAALPASGADQQVVDLTVAGTQAKKVLNVRETPDGPLSHRAYLWRREGKNPALVTITQQGTEQPDPKHMEMVFDRLLAGIAP